MASPFPGMDPYLESDLWQEFHDRLANQISAQLMPQMTPYYVALLAKRYVVDRPALGIFAPPSEQSFTLMYTSSPSRCRSMQRPVWSRPRWN